MELSIGDRVRWVPDKPCDWAGDGCGVVRAIDLKRVLFGDEGPMKTGVAVKVVLDNKGLDVWCPLSELMPELKVPS